MPKAHIHEGPYYSLIPLKSSSDDERTPAEITEEAARTHDWSGHSYERGFRAVGDPGDGVVSYRQEPSLVIHWTKQRDHMNENGPGDHGYVTLEMLVDEEQLRTIVANFDRERERAKELGAGVPMDHVRVSITTSSLSWRDLNMLAKAARDARDGAFGKPE